MYSCTDMYRLPRYKLNQLKIKKTKFVQLLLLANTDSFTCAFKGVLSTDRGAVLKLECNLHSLKGPIPSILVVHFTS